MTVANTPTVKFEIFKEFDGNNLSKAIFKKETSLSADKLSPGQLSNFTAYKLDEKFGFDFKTQGSGVSNTSNAVHLTLSESLTASDDLSAVANEVIVLQVSIDSSDLYNENCLTSLCLLLETTEVP